MSKHPYADTRLAKFLEQWIDELRGTRAQVEIAEIAGYKTPNMITMLKLGQTKLPIDRVPMMAKALEVDPALLLRLTFEQVFDETTPVPSTRSSARRSPRTNAAGSTSCATPRATATRG